MSRPISSERHITENSWIVQKYNQILKISSQMIDTTQEFNYLQVFVFLNT